MHKFLFLKTAVPTLAFFLSMTSLSAQHETIGDPFKQVDIEKMPRSAPYFFKKNARNGTAIETRQVNVDANGMDILGDAANEPSIAISPIDPLRMAIGWRQFDDVGNNFRQAGAAFSNDGGKTWTNPGVVIRPGEFRSDPVLASDAEGRFYYNSLSVPILDCTVFRSTADGEWDNGTYAFGGDKAWMAIDRTNGPGKGNIYEHWSAGAGVCPPNNFSRSINGGDDFETCNQMALGLQWGACDINADGELYVAGVNGGLVRSSNAQTAGATIEWTSLTNVDLGGFPGSFINNSPNPVGLLGQTWVVTNHAPGSQSEVYMMATVVTNAGDWGDAMFNRSSNGGLTWGSPIRINDDPGLENWQWMGAISVSPNGRLDVVWLDTRDDPGTFLSSLYYSNSYDGGLSWSSNERLSDAFDPHIGWPNQSKIGDYFHMLSDDEGASLAWAGTFNGGQDVYFSRITPGSVGAGEAVNDRYFLRAAPNPFLEKTTVSFHLSEKKRTQLEVLDGLGRVMAQLLDEELPPGQRAIEWDGRSANQMRLPPGIYFGKLSVDGNQPRFIKLILGN